MQKRNRFAEVMAEALRRGVQGGVMDDAPPPPPVEPKPPVLPSAPAPAKAAPAADPEVARLKAENERFTAEEAKRKEDARKAADAKRIEDGKLKEVLAERDAELERLRAEKAEGEKAQRARAKELLAALPEAARTKVQDLEGEMSPAAYIKLLERERDAQGPGIKKPTPPSMPAPRPGGADDAEKYEVHDGVTDILRHMGKRNAAKALEDKQIEHNPYTEAFYARQPVGEFIERMNGRINTKVIGKREIKGNT